VNGVNVLVHKGVYTEADVVGPGNIQLFSVAVNKVAVFLPGTFVRYESPSPTGLVSVMTIGADNGQMFVSWNDTNVTENLCFTTTQDETFAGDASVELSVHLAPGPFTLTVSVRYILVTV
jgi:hypothetical protein